MLGLRTNTKLGHLGVHHIPAACGLGDEKPLLFLFESSAEDDICPTSSAAVCVDSLIRYET